MPSDNALWQILKCINVEKYCWHNILSQNEVWANHRGGISFEKAYYDGKAFLQSIIADHFIIFLKLQAYFENDKFFDIHTYEDFQNSNCQLLLLVWDCEYVDVYIKDRSVAQSIYENALANDYLEVKYITESNDSRIKMDIV